MSRSIFSIARLYNENNSRPYFFAVALTSGLASFPALSDTVLQVTAWGGPNHEVNIHIWPTWGKWVEEATDGRVTVNITHDMGPPGSQMAIVADGIADVGYFFHGYNPGRFELTKLPELPTFEDYSSEIASAAYWYTHQNSSRMPMSTAVSSRWD